jgi:integrase
MTAKTIRFTKETIDRLPTPLRGEPRAEYRDEKVSGLALRVSSGGKKTFCFYGWCKAKAAPHRETFGQYPALSIDRAQAMAKCVAARIAEGKDPAEERRKKRPVLTFAGLFTRYIEQYAKPKRLRTVDEIVKKFHRHLEKPLGSQPITRITKGDMAQLHAKLTAEAGPTTANRIHSLVLGVFNWGMKLDLIDSNPAKGVDRNAEVSREDYIEEEEMPYFLDAANREPNPDMGDLFLLCLFTGQRVGSVKAMQWQNIYFGEKPIWSIPRTKNGRPHKVNLIGPAMVVLQRRFALRTGSAFVFPGIGKSGHLQEPKKGWNRVSARAEAYRLIDVLVAQKLVETKQRDELALEAAIHPERVRDRLRTMADEAKLPWEPFRMDDLRIHDLRRTMGSWLANNHASQWIIGKVLGHLSPQSTAIYARAGLGAARDSMSAVVESMISVPKRVSGLPVSQSAEVN